MGKLGKKARKFAKKNLQSVLKRKRKLKSMLKKKAPARQDEGSVENQKDDASKLRVKMNGEADENKNVSLDAIFREDDYDMLEDESDSDGYISEESSSFKVAENGIENNSEGGSGMVSPNDSTDQNKEIHSELAKKTNQLKRLKEKSYMKWGIVRLMGGQFSSKGC